MGNKSASKPRNFEELADPRVWTDPQQWAVQVGIYNDQCREEGADPTDPGFTPSHARQAREYQWRQARANGVRQSA